MTASKSVGLDTVACLTDPLATSGLRPLLRQRRPTPLRPRSPPNAGEILLRDRPGHLVDMRAA
jgi:hypothetical protein